MPHSELDILRRALRDAFGDPAARLHVHPDGLPRDWSVPVPHPDGFTLLGSLESVAPPTHVSATVFFDTSLAVQDSERLLAEALTDGGWEGVRQTLPRPSGFLTREELAWAPPTESGSAHLFLHRAARCVAFLQGREEEDGTHLTLRLEQGPAYAHHARQEEGLFPALPLLPVPPGLTVQPLGGGASASSVAAQAHTVAQLSGSGTTPDLQRHFAGELTRQGWQPGDGAGTDDVWASTWLLSADAGLTLGTLVLVQMMEREWQAQFSALQRRRGQDGPVSWSAHSF